MADCSCRVRCRYCNVCPDLFSLVQKLSPQPSQFDVPTSSTSEVTEQPVEAATIDWDAFYAAVKSHVPSSKLIKDSIDQKLKEILRLVELDNGVVNSDFACNRVLPRNKKMEIQRRNLKRKL